VAEAEAPQLLQLFLRELAVLKVLVEVPERVILGQLRELVGRERAVLEELAHLLPEPLGLGPKVGHALLEGTLDRVGLLLVDRAVVDEVGEDVAEDARRPRRGRQCGGARARLGDDGGRTGDDEEHPKGDAEELAHEHLR
jgi:hypothetical protein